MRTNRTQDVFPIDVKSYSIVINTILSIRLIRQVSIRRERLCD